ncbi:hypothetical protein HBH47_061270 [Parastagonospora nodorum]|nr:hypothetical protein HBH47_061270 [Parastagonospora nodorum]KAH5095876.1 hypothetical protein HBH72_145410 [Parastagonospora nodorum]
MAHAYSPVSPIEMQPPPTTAVNTSRTQTFNASNASRSGTFQKGGWLPFTLRWYYLVVPTILSLCLGSVLVYLSIHSRQNHGLGEDDGSSAILFGWRFTPTLIAVFYAQMTVILFEDVKRTEPFTRLAKAPAGGTGAYGTLLQTPRAWWSIFIDVCFRRKKLGHTSWSLICAALINVIALLVISPLSSALLTSEEVLVPKSVQFSKLVPRANTQIPMIPTRETYYRSMNAVMRNVSTSAWLNDTSLAFPFWPSLERAQFGPTLVSSYSSWNTETTALQSRHQCQTMNLTSAEIAPKRYSGVYVMQGYGPLNGTQPMATFILESNDGCKYELSIHPGADLAAYGGMTWSDASTFIPTSKSNLPIGGRVFTSNMTSTDVYSRVNASEQCHGRDIIIATTPFTMPQDADEMRPGFLPQNATYVRSSQFRMRALLCDFEYLISNQTMKAVISGGSTTITSASTDTQKGYRQVPSSIINVAQFQETSATNDWLNYFDDSSMRSDTARAAEGSSAKIPSFSGMAPLLAVNPRFNLTAILDDPNLAQQVGSIKNRFFMEMLRDAFTNPRLVETETLLGQGAMVQTRVVVLMEIGITLAALFFASAVLFAVIYINSRISRRPLNLRSDPASTVGLSLMFSQRLARSSIIRRMHDASRVDFYTALQGEKYFTSDNELHKGDQNADTPFKVKPRTNWRPRVIHRRMLLSLGGFLALVLVAVLIMNAFSARSQLSQRAFVSEVDVSKLRLSFSTFAPISIAPTVISIIVGLWWDQLDSTFRILQPFISMSRGPTPLNKGAGLTYRSKTWMGAAIKAGRNKHWVLLLISMGSVLAQVLTVSMSALFEQETRSVSQQVSVPQNLEMRQLPLITQVNMSDAGPVSDPAIKVLNTLYEDAPTNWLYGAGIQDSYNGSKLPWTAEGWNFLPVDLSSATNSTIAGTVVDRVATGIPLANVTVSTPAIRARLDCRAVVEVANTSTWINQTTLDNDDEEYPENEWVQINTTSKVNAFQLLSRIFVGTDSHTSMISRTKVPTCCGNGTRTEPQRSIMGYWSPVYPPAARVEDNFPYDNMSWPMEITTKWLVGTAFNLSLWTGKERSLFYTDVPRLQAARCQPIIETAEATVTLDAGTGNVLSHKIEDAAKAADTAWGDVFTEHQSSNKDELNKSSSQLLNVTASYGILFLDSLLGTADRIKGTGATQGLLPERTDQNAFAFRDPNNGINMDLMTYSMYLLAEKDPEALLNYTTLATYADRTFQTFFQHFVNSKLSLDKGGYAYQPISDNSMNSMGQSPENGAGVAANTGRTITASISHRIRVLHMNVIATYLSTAILIWLILTTFVVLCLQRKYTRFMNRDVQLIADMLVLVAGSDNFLELVAEKGVELKKSRDIQTMLGWFKGRDGQVRWGVEVVGGRNAVTWVDAPKQGFHVPVQTSSKLWAWRPWKTT